MSPKLIVTVGDLVAVNDLPDGQVYTVEAREGFGVQLSYETTAMGKITSAGWMDVSYLQHPTREQLANELKKAREKA